MPESVETTTKKSKSSWLWAFLVLCLIVAVALLIMVSIPSKINDYDSPMNHLDELFDGMDVGDGGMQECTC